MTLAVPVENQSYKYMVDQTPLYDNQDMRNGNGDPSQALVPVVPKIDEPEELSMALQATDLSFLQDIMTQSSARIFVYAH